MVSDFGFPQGESPAAGSVSRMRIFSRGAHAQDADYRERWRLHAAEAEAGCEAAEPAGAGGRAGAGGPKGAEGPIVWVVLGDSAAVGVGAETWEDSYVFRVASRVAEETGRAVRVVNFAVSGATASDVLDVQVPQLEALLAAGRGGHVGAADGAGRAVDAVTCVVGGNDVTWALRFRLERFAAPLEEIARRLPAGATLGLVPSFRFQPFEGRVLAANRAVRGIAARHGLGVADVHTATLRRDLAHQLSHLAADRFHPNARGYADWAAAVVPEVLRQVIHDR